MNDETVWATLRLRIDGEPLEIRMRMPTGSASPQTLLPTLWQLEQGLIDAAVARLTREGGSVSCRAGCGRCCRQFVPISRTEAHQLAELVASMPTPRRERIEHRFAEGIERIRQAGLLARCESMDRLDGPGLRHLGIDWFALDLACPFLEAESCSIHAQRPLACREYLVSSPAEHCANPSPQTVQMVSIGARLSNAAALLDGEETEAARDARADAPAGRGRPRLGLPLLFALDATARGTAPEAIPDAPALIRRVVESMANGPAQP